MPRDSIDNVHALCATAASEDWFLIGNLPSAFRAHADWTAGAYTMMEQRIAPRLLVPPHTHAFDDHVSYVISGRIGFRTGDKEYELKAGESIFRPRGVPHTLWNPSDDTAVMLELTSPGRLEEYIGELRALGYANQATSENVAELARRYGVEFDTAWVDDLCARHGVIAGASFWQAAEDSVAEKPGGLDGTRE
ncbi:cupin domain-containing protein [Mycobacterium aquaticum]|nr:cupin domain-containing protein [Mycobacterium aquaticum]